jgi:hypothetical protein
MEHSKCKICGEKHALGGCPEFKARAVALGQARAMAKINPFEDAARGRDPVPKSSGGGVEGHARLAQAGTARKAPRSTTERPALPVQVDEAGINPGPPEAKRKRAPRGTFDRNAYQREYMRKRRTPGKK